MTSSAAIRDFPEVDPIMGIFAEAVSERAGRLWRCRRAIATCHIDSGASPRVNGPMREEEQSLGVAVWQWPDQSHLVSRLSRAPLAALMDEAAALSQRGH